MSRERPILFSAPMVRAILEGRKTQTRRVVKDVPAWCEKWGYTAFTPAGSISARGPFEDNVGEKFFRLKYGAPGDRLWVRETCAIVGAVDPGFVLYRASDYTEQCQRLRLENCPPANEIRWRPSIHMPRWASRINLEVTGVRVKRVQDINWEDAVAEGCDIPDPSSDEARPAGFETWEQTSRRLQWPQRQYSLLWRSINGPDSWDENPWVWVIEFKRVPQ